MVLPPCLTLPASLPIIICMRNTFSGRFRGWAVSLAVLAVGCSAPAQKPVDASSATVQFVYTSDSHYGVTRPSFRGRQDVDAHVVNKAMVAQINALAGATLPDDGGVMAGRKIGGIDFLVNSGDIANRQESSRSVQSATVSWKQFKADYLDGLTLKDPVGRALAIFLLPGNHDVSNAIGYYRPMVPRIDATAMAEIYNLMMKPAKLRTKSTYNYATDKVNYSRDIKGVHLAFINLWPDAEVRAWLANDLKAVSSNTPVLIFAHDQPDIESKHLTNPNGRHDINAVDKFENMVAEQLKDGMTTEAPSTIEQNELGAFLKEHPNVKAYFHGNENFNEFYTWTSPDRRASIRAFRVDSPMRGRVSESDEKKLSFQVGVIDMAAKSMTVRECLWNVSSTSLCWGASATVPLK
jgi:hypothetical protein